VEVVVGLLNYVDWVRGVRRVVPETAEAVVGVWRERYFIRRSDQAQQMAVTRALLACLSYIVLAMGSLAFQHRRLRNS
jgi:hypothetical protein